MTQQSRTCTKQNVPAHVEQDLAGLWQASDLDKDSASDRNVEAGFNAATIVGLDELDMSRRWFIRRRFANFHEQLRAKETAKPRKGTGMSWFQQRRLGKSLDKMERS